MTKSQKLRFAIRRVWETIPNPKPTDEEYYQNRMDGIIRSVEREIEPPLEEE